MRTAPRLIVGTIFAVLALAAVARAHGPGCSAHRAAELSQALGLTAEQDKAFTQMHGDLRTALQPLHEQLHQIRKDIEAELAAENPQAQRVGELVISAHKLELQIDAIFTQYRERFLKTLDDEQRAKAETLLPASLAGFREHRGMRGGRGPLAFGHPDHPAVDPGDSGL